MKRDVPLFEDRADAGRQLAQAIASRVTGPCVVLALPRGGVPVGWEIARALDAPLDVIVARKLGAPGHPELGVGAVVDGDHPETLLNESLIRQLGVDRRYLEGEITRQLVEIHRRLAVFRHGRPPVAVAGRTAVVVDDGIATGATVRAALRAARRSGARRVVLAIPVAPPDVFAALRDDVDDVVCLAMPEPFGSVGRFYHDFHQLTDDEVVELLARAGARRAAPSELSAVAR